MLYHGTSPEAASKIRHDGFSVAENLRNRPWVSATTDRDWAAAFGESIIVIDASTLRIMPRAEVEAYGPRGFFDCDAFKEYVLERGYDAFEEVNEESEIAIVNLDAISII